MKKYEIDYYMVLQQQHPKWRFIPWLADAHDAAETLGSQDWVCLEEEDELRVIGTVEEVKEAGTPNASDTLSQVE